MTDTYHGVDVTEDYRWLEDASSEETIAWTKAQQQRTRAYFDWIPWRDALRARVEQLLKAERTTYKRLLSGGSSWTRSAARSTPRWTRGSRSSKRRSRRHGTGAAIPAPRWRSRSSLWPWA